jgi:hypothetical protein
LQWLSEDIRITEQDAIAAIGKEILDRARRRANDAGFTDTDIVLESADPAATIVRKAGERRDSRWARMASMRIGAPSRRFVARGSQRGAAVAAIRTSRLASVLEFRGISA